MDNAFLIDRTRIPLTERDMLIFATIEPLLKKARLSLFCPRCFEQGLSDGGIRGNNGLNDQVWRIECNCSVRLAENPTTETQTAG